MAIVYVFVDTDNGTATPTIAVHTSSAWPSNSNRFNRISTALANATVIAQTDSLVILCQGAADDTVATTLGDALLASDITIIGNVTSPQFDSSKYYINVGGGGATVFSITRTISNVTLKNLQFGSNGTAAQRALNIASASGTSTITVDSCIINSGGTATSGIALGIGNIGNSIILKITNNILWSTTNLTSRSGFYENTGAGQLLYFYNNTVQGFNIGIERKASGGASGHIYKNNVVFNNTDDFNTSTASGMIVDYNISDDGDGTNAYIMGSGIFIGRTWNSEFVDYINNNYSLKTTNKLKNLGLGSNIDSNVPTTDFNGVSRLSTTTSLGAVAIAPSDTVKFYHWNGSSWSSQYTYNVYAALNQYSLTCEGASVVQIGSESFVGTSGVTPSTLTNVGDSPITYDGSGAARNFGGNRAAAYFNGTFSNDQYSEVTITALASSSGGGPMVRIQTGEAATIEKGYVLGAILNSPYYFSCYDQSSGDQVILNTNIYPQIGDRVRISIVGNLITGWVNGACIGQVTNSIYASGKPGLFIYEGVCRLDELVVGNEKGYLVRTTLPNVLAQRKLSLSTGYFYANTIARKTDFIDNFNRVNESLDASANWQRADIEVGSLSIVSNAVTGSNIGNVYSTALANNQWAQFTFSGIFSTGTGKGAAILLRATGNSSNFTGYAICLTRSNTEPNTDLLQIRKVLGSTNYTDATTLGIFLASYRVAEFSNAGNVLISAEIIGSNIYVYIDNKYVFTVNDTDITSGKAGIWTDSAIIDDFSCGSFTDTLTLTAGRVLSANTGRFTVSDQLKYRDTFTYSNGNLTTVSSNNWIARSGGMVVSNGEVYGFSGTATDINYSELNTSVYSFSSSQESEIVISKQSIFDFIGPAVRMTASGCYAIQTDGGNDQGRRLYKFSGTTATLIGNVNIPCVDGDLLKIRAVGTQISIYKNGSLLETVTDSTYSSGQPGIFYNRGNLNITRGDNFVAYSIAADSILIKAGKVLTCTAQSYALSTVNTALTYAQVTQTTFGTPVAAAAAYNTAGASTTVAPAYPTGITTTDVVLLFVGQKPSTANGGTVTTPNGWTLRDELTAAGGYGTTLGADTGNTNLRVYSWNTPVANQTGTLSLTLGTNDISWAFIVRIPTGGNSISYGTSDGSDITAGDVSVTLAANPGLKAGDLAIWAMSIPTDVGGAAQFSNHTITATGAGFLTPQEINEPSSGTGNDIGGFSAWTIVSSGSATVAPTITATAAATNTNVRGPLVLVRLHENVRLTADPRSYSLTGNTLNFTVARKAIGDVRSYTLTGNAVNLLYARRLTLDIRTYSLTGNDTGLLRKKILILDQRSYSFTGNNANLLFGKKVIADVRSYSLTGNNLTLTRTLRVTLDFRTYSFTGIAANLAKGKSLTLDVCSYSLTGQDLLFSYIPVIPTTFGTPVAGAAAYNTAGAPTTVAPAYPTGITTTDVVLLFVGQKPSTANGGTVTTPNGWTLRDELTAAGGYGATLAADTGNTNLRVYSWNSPVANQTGTLSITLGTNDISWAFIVRIPTGGNLISYGAADGSDIDGGDVSITLSSNPGLAAGDLAIWAMSIPTDVTTPTQFSNHGISATGAVFATPQEINEPDSNVGNDIGGFSAWTAVTYGSATVAPTITATAAATNTNVRGPLVLIRLRETAPFTAERLILTLTGINVNLNITRKLIADVRSYSLTGNVLNINAPKKVIADVRNYTLTGNTANLTIARTILANTRTLILTQNAVNLTVARKVIADVRSYSLTGNTANLLRGVKVTLDTRSYLLSGNTANLLAGRKVIADVRSYSLTGNAVNLIRTLRVLLNVRSYSLTGNTANLLRGVRVTLDTRSYSLTGNAVNLLRTVRVTLDTRSYSLTGNTANLLSKKIITGDARSYSLTGNAANLLRGKRLTLDTVSYSLIRNNANLIVARKVIATVQSYSLVSYQLQFVSAERLVTDVVTYTLTGNSLDILRTQQIFPITSRSYSLTGNTVNLLRGVRLTLTTRSYSLTGNIANLLRGVKVTLDTRSYSLTGNAANLLAGRKVTADVRSYSLTGNAANLLHKALITLTPRSYLLTGNTANITIARKLLLVTSSYSLSTVSANLIAYRKLTINVRSYNLTINTFNFIITRKIILDARSYSLTGNTVNFIITRKIIADVRFYSLTGNTANLLRGVRVTLDTRSHSLTGSVANLLAGRKVTANVSAYSLNSSAVSLLRKALITLTPRSYLLTDNAANLLAGRKVTANVSAYSLNSSAVSLLRAKILTLDTRTYSLTAYAAVLSAGEILHGDTCSYSITTSELSFVVARIFRLNVTTYTQARITTNLLASRKILVQTNNITLNSFAINILAARKLLSSTENYSISATLTDILAGKYLNAQNLTTTINTSLLKLNYGRIIYLDTNNLTLQGSAYLIAARIFHLGYIQLQLSGYVEGGYVEDGYVANSANILKGTRLYLEGGSFIIIWPFVNINLLNGYIKVWNGSVWIAKPLKVWNGTAWVSKPLKVWTGSVWKTF